MSLTHKKLNRIIAAIVFLYAFIIYLMTLAPTASFWDPGEFIAVAHGLEVTHPPGAPLFILLGHFFSMFVPASKVAYSINLLSGLASALAVMLLYLSIILLTKEWKGDPDAYTPLGKIGLYAGGIIGAITFAVTDSFWFNAVEANVFATSLFFMAMVVWLVLKWMENYDQPRNERWLILISYMFGLAIGVHLLNLLAMFFVVPIIYFKKYDFKISTFLIAAVIASACLLTIYPLTISELPRLSGYLNKVTLGFINPAVFLIIIVGLLVFGIYYTHKTKKRFLNIALLCYSMIIIGFSSYALVVIRSNQDPPINEDDPSTVQSFVNYINRTQYGSTPLFEGYDYNNDTGQIDHSHKVFFPRRYDGDQQEYLQKYAQYKNDWDFFWNYQVGHMYLRYFAWQFIGRQSDIQDTGWTGGFSKSRYTNNPAHNVYFYLPFLLGLIGMIFHFEKDWKRALCVLALFIMTGFAIIVFLNQYPFQPRERDYSYVGSFFAYAIWVGIGVTGLVEMSIEAFKSNKWVAYGLVGISFLAVPMNMLRENFFDHDRSKRYVAADYAYNLLNSCAPYAILFTNGDNDTFPLWYLQEVRHVRTDVRVVCLSLLDTKWYIKQLRDQWSHQSPPLPISLTDSQINHLYDKFKFNSLSDFYTPDTLRIPVDKQYLKKRFSDPDSTEKFAEEGHVGVIKKKFQIDSPRMKFTIPVDSLDNSIHWFYQGRYAGQGPNGKKLYYTMVHDDIVLNILRNNHWARPVYFAVTVSNKSQLNLQSYFRLEGQAYRVVPKRNPTHNAYINTSLQASMLRKFRFRGVNDPHVYLDQNIRRMMENDREIMASEAMSFRNIGKPDSAIAWLRWGEEKIPFSHIKGDPNSQIIYAYKFASLGDTKDALKLGSADYTSLKNDLQYSMNDLSSLESRIMDLNNKSKEARLNADLNESMNYRKQAQDLMHQHQDLIRNVYYAATRLIVLQHIYYQAGDSTKAEQIAKIGNNMTSNRFQFPNNAGQCEKVVKSIFGG